MLSNILIWLAFVAVVVWLGWLTFRAWRAKNKLVKFAGGSMSSLLTLVLALVTGVLLVGMIKAYAPRSAPVPELKSAGSPEQLERGKHLADSFCASCHSPTNELPLTGGLDLGKDFPMPLGSFVSANLTPGGRLKDWSDGEIFRAIRNGVDRDGNWLFVMSGARGRFLSDADIEALIAYLRSQPVVTNDTPMPLDQPNVLGFLMLGTGLLPAGEAPITEAISMPPKGATAEFGKYILSYQDCVACHGEDLSGGEPGQLAPLGPNLALVKKWTQEQFITTLRTGIDPDGHALNNQVMPWKNIGRMDDEELAAVYAYLTSLPLSVAVQSTP
ncbi:Nicotinate dehydrogenase subunit B [Thermoflexales bacterium]|nr:Nicotinate dehydrogenase subunit B [Thermoflexales bacterium]